MEDSLLAGVFRPCRAACLKGRKPRQKTRPLSLMNTGQFSLNLRVMEGMFASYWKYRKEE